jgi:hypothetical protein
MSARRTSKRRSAPIGKRRSAPIGKRRSAPIGHSFPRFPACFRSGLGSSGLQILGSTLPFV